MALRTWDDTPVSYGRDANQWGFARRVGDRNFRETIPRRIACGPDAREQAEGWASLIESRPPLPLPDLQLRMDGSWVAVIHIEVPAEKALGPAEEDEAFAWAERFAATGKRR